jgi:hypothetical protein
LALCEHLLNENPQEHFLLVWRDEKTGSGRFAKSRTQKAGRRASWAWDTVTGRAKSPSGIGFYPSTPDGKSRWAAMDLDSHDGEVERARAWAMSAFRLLLRHPDLFLILCTSGGGGWHLFVLSEGFHSCDEWIRLLKQVAAWIGAPVEAGKCELFPNEHSGRQKIGYGIRAPGTWNPKYLKTGEILFQNIKPLLRERAKLERETPIGKVKGLYRETFPIQERETSFSLSFPALWDIVGGNERFMITETRTRHTKLASLVGTAFHQISRTMAEKLVVSQYAEKTVTTNADSPEHTIDFASLWTGMERQWLDSLLQVEREYLDRLETDAQRSSFRIIRNYAMKATQDGAADFPIARENLALRLGITGPGAGQLRQKFVKLGIINLTVPYRPNVTAARYRWLPSAFNEPF